ncbi:MAG: hypothetical protein ACLQT7_11605 [Candidatus Dormibacteria bacterium]
MGQLEGLGGPEILHSDGSITPPSPYPIGGEVILVGADGYSISVSVGSAGTFTLQVPAGKYTVMGASAGNHIGDDCSASAPITVAPDSITTVTVGCGTP